MRQYVRWLLLGVMGVVVAGCGSTAATAPTGAPTTESFSGTVGVGALAYHPFTVVASGGQLSITLTAAAPPTGVNLGVGVGAYANSTCTGISGASTAGPASPSPLITGSFNAGSYCLMVFDAGNMTSPVAYSVVVTHY